MYYWDRAAGPGARRFAAARTTRYIHQGAPDAWAGGRQNFTPYVSMWQHHARLTGVEPGTTLVYAAYTGAGGREGAPVEVAVPPRASAYGGDPAQGFTLGVVGDLGQTEHSATTVEHLMRCDHAAVLLVGDLSYADKENTRWDSWRDFVQPYFDHEPLLSLPGNHEIETDVAGESFRPCAHRFQMMLPSGVSSGGWTSGARGARGGQRSGESPGPQAGTPPQVPLTPCIPPPQAAARRSEAEAWRDEARSISPLCLERFRRVNRGRGGRARAEIGGESLVPGPARTSPEAPP